jgi:hypothetical protein
MLEFPWRDWRKQIEISFRITGAPAMIRIELLPVVDLFE